MKVFNGKEKAWVASFITAMATFAVQVVNGQPGDVTVFNDFAQLTGELTVSGVLGAIAYFWTYVTANTPEENPAENPVDA